MQTTPDGLIMHELPTVGWAVSAAEHNFKMSELASQLETYKRDYNATIVACLFMHEEKDLNLVPGQRITLEGIGALKKQRDELKAALAAVTLERDEQNGRMEELTGQLKNMRSIIHNSVPSGIALEIAEELDAVDEFLKGRNPLIDSLRAQLAACQSREQVLIADALRMDEIRIHNSKGYDEVVAALKDCQSREAAIPRVKEDAYQDSEFITRTKPFLVARVFSGAITLDEFIERFEKSVRLDEKADRDQLRVQVGALRTALIKFFNYLGKRIQKITLNDSAADGTQELSLEIAKLLDQPAPAAPDSAKKHP